MTPRQLLRWIEREGIVLQSAKGTVPNAADHIAGERIRGSWWAHAKGQDIFRLLEAVADSGDVLVCRLVDGKLTFVHRRLWPALVRLARRFDRSQLAAIRSVHTAAGHHINETTPFPKWVPEDVKRAAKTMTVQQAAAALDVIIARSASDASASVSNSRRKSRRRTASRAAR
ncbi:MAG TPA: hypothetical protein VFL80_10030 [Thermoanaerobaculia bacterium]|nr:hypothetical protein [Thermoanaerobaculia bacterium]